MSVKFVALFKQPEDPETFLRTFNEEHVPLLLKVPGPTSADITKLDRDSFGNKPDVFLVVTIGFPDRETFKAAALSPEWRAATENLMTFAKGIVTAYVGS
ncbi:MAG: EthD family reductase [Candidatus Sericytochromatia bacterium]|nr:EthD family reductase [Candidatus Tanganyikabacteria bacterium]